MSATFRSDLCHHIKWSQMVAERHTNHLHVTRKATNKELVGDDPRTDHTNTTHRRYRYRRGRRWQVHVGKLDVGTEDQTESDAKTIAKTATDHKDSDSEFQKQLPNTVDSVAGVQKFITEPDDKRCDADGQQCDNDGSSNVRSEAGRQHPRSRVQHAKSQSRRHARRSKQAFTDRQYILEVEAELQKISDDTLVLVDKNLIPSTSTGGRRGFSSR